MTKQAKCSTADIYCAITDKLIESELLGVKACTSRDAARTAIEPLLTANRVTFKTYGPHSNARFDPESSAPAIWRRKMLESIIPNNKRVIAILDKNRGLMVDQEPETLELFRQHTEDLIARHLADADAGQQFPKAMDRMMEG
jgi:hypothetical protein